MLGPTLTAQRYVQLLQNEVEEFVDNLPLAVAHNMYFQRDGVPADNAGVGATLLNELYSERWIGSYRLTRWPARSPVLTPIDFFIWGHVTDVVDIHPPQSLEELRQ